MIHKTTRVVRIAYLLVLTGAVFLLGGLIKGGSYKKIATFFSTHSASADTPYYYSGGEGGYYESGCSYHAYESSMTCEPGGSWSSNDSDSDSGSSCSSGGDSGAESGGNCGGSDADGGDGW